MFSVTKNAPICKSLFATTLLLCCITNVHANSSRTQHTASTTEGQQHEQSAQDEADARKDDWCTGKGCETDKSEPGKKLPTYGVQPTTLSQGAINSLTEGGSLGNGGANTSTGTGGGSGSGNTTNPEPKDDKDDKPVNPDCIKADNEKLDCENEFDQDYRTNMFQCNNKRSEQIRSANAALQIMQKEIKGDGKIHTMTSVTQTCTHHKDILMSGMRSCMRDYLKQTNGKNCPAPSSVPIN